MELKIVLKPKDIVTEGMKDFIQKELNSVFVPQGMDRESVSVKVTVNAEGRSDKTSIVVIYNSRKKSLSTFRAEVVGDFYESFPSLVKTANKKIKKAYNTIESKRVSSKNVNQIMNSDEFDFIELVKHKKVDNEAMTIDDAINKMENLGYDFYLFLNIEEDNIPSVIYRRVGGGYGCLES